VVTPIADIERAEEDRAERELATLTGPIPVLGSDDTLDICRERVLR